MRVIADLIDRPLESGDATSPEVLHTDVARVYASNADFVWASLQRLGVRAPDLDDVLQEVFVVVHQRLHTFDGSSKMTTWLFGICLRVVSAYRRRGFRRKETIVAEPPEPEGASTSPEQEMAEVESRRRLDALLDELELDRRAVFVMFEIDDMPCEEIAQLLGVPVGTVYSRLHAARKEFQRALVRMQARDAHRTSWRTP